MAELGLNLKAAVSTSMLRLPLPLDFSTRRLSDTLNPQTWWRARGITHVSQKQFANINNFQCQERRWWEDALKVQRNLTSPVSPSPSPALPLPAQPWQESRGAQKQSRKWLEGCSLPLLMGGVRLARLFSPPTPPLTGFCNPTSFRESEENRWSPACIWNGPGLLPLGCIFPCP